jgi:aconitate hydratase 2/2-methylisocitrate dehydratase
MGVGSSRMSGVNNVALWTGKKASPYVPFINISIICWYKWYFAYFPNNSRSYRWNWIDLKTGQKLDSQGNVVFDEAGEATLEEVYSVATGTVLTIN